MLVERKNLLTGKANVMDLDITMDQLQNWLHGQPVQDAMPNLNETEREFLISGMSAEEQKVIWG